MLGRTSRTILMVSVSAAAIAQSPADAPRMTVHSIRPGKLYWVEGGGGNSGIIIASSGVILVDAKMTAEAGAQLVREVAKITSKPITHVILTHSDGDHVNGLAGLPADVKVVAHVNNKMEQIATLRIATVEVGGGKCLPPRDRLPGVIVAKARADITIDGEPISLRYFGPAHTSGDLVVYLPSDRFAFAGDLIADNLLVHQYKGGSLAGWFAAATALKNLPAVHYLGGHTNSLDTKTTLQTRIDSTQRARAKVDALVDAGRTLPEVKAALGDPQRESAGCRGIPYPSLSEVEFVERRNVLEQVR